MGGVVAARLQMIAASAVATAVLVAGCGDTADINSDAGTQPAGDTSTTTAAAPPTSIPELPEPAALVPGTPGVYLAMTLSKDSSIFRDTGSSPILLESATNGIALWNADTRQAAVLTTDVSASYARSKVLPLTAGGRLFTVREADTGDVTYTEYAAETGTADGASGRLSGNITHYAFSGTTGFFVNRIERLGQPALRQLIRQDLASGNSTVVEAFGLTGNGTLLAADNAPYYVTMPRKEDPRMEVYRLGGSPGSEPQTLAVGRIDGYDTYAKGSFQTPTMNGTSIVWLAAVRGATSTEIQVWHYDVAASPGQFEQAWSFEIEVSGPQLQLFDVDGRYLAAHILHDDGQTLLVFNGETNEAELLPLDLLPYGLAVLDFTG